MRYLLLLSKGDTWGFVVPEALANGVIPVVSPGVGCAADVVAPLCEDLIVADTSQALRVIRELESDDARRQWLINRGSAQTQQRTAQWAAAVFS